MTTTSDPPTDFSSFSGVDHEYSVDILQNNTTTPDPPADFSSFSHHEYSVDPYALMEEILDISDSGLRTEDPDSGFHFQTEGSLIQFYCQL